MGAERSFKHLYCWLVTRIVEKGLGVCDEKGKGSFKFYVYIIHYNSYIFYGQNFNLKQTSFYNLLNNKTYKFVLFSESFLIISEFRYHVGRSKLHFRTTLDRAGTLSFILAASEIYRERCF